GRGSRLVVQVKAGEQFAGPPAKVELVVLPERVPGFVAGQERKGVYGGNLTRRGEELSLVAEDLRFGGSTTRRGPVYLTVDGYDRAFTFNVTFPPAGTAGAPVEVTKAGLALDAPAYAVPKAAIKVGL